MEFTVQTPFNLTTLTALSGALRKTLRTKKSRKTTMFATVIMVLGLVLILSRESFDVNSAITVIVVLVMGFVLLNQDTLNGWLTLKRGIPGLKSSVTVFRQENYTSVTEVGESVFYYENVLALAESKAYFFLLFGPNHGQVYAKSGLTGGTVEEFRCFVQERTGLTIQEI